MTALALTAAQRREHRAASHHLDPVVTIGADGLTPAVRKEADAALSAHGLIKVRVFSDDRNQRELLLAELADTLDAAPRVVKVLKFSKSGNHRPQVKKLTVRGNERLTAGGTVKRARKRPASTGTKKRSLQT